MFFSIELHSWGTLRTGVALGTILRGLFIWIKVRVIIRRIVWQGVAFSQAIALLINVCDENLVAGMWRMEGLDLSGEEEIFGLFQA